MDEKELAFVATAGESVFLNRFLSSIDKNSLKVFLDY